MPVVCSVYVRNPYSNTKGFNVYEAQCRGGQWVWICIDMYEGARARNGLPLIKNLDDYYVSIDHLKQLPQTEDVKVLAMRLLLNGC